MNAVITADIVNSTMMARPSFKHMMDELTDLFEKNRMEIFRGDSFQAFVENAADALLHCVKSRLMAIKYTSDNRIDIRMSISIGILQADVVKLGANMEELFINSGRYFDKLQNSSRKLYIVSGQEDKNFTYEILAEYLDSIFERITARQAEVLYQLFCGKTQVEIAALLKKTTATINQHVKAARYEEISNILQKFEILTNRL